MTKVLSLTLAAIVLSVFSGCQSCDGLLPGCGDGMPRMGLFGKHRQCDTCDSGSPCSTCGDTATIYPTGGIVEGYAGGSNCNCNNGGQIISGGTLNSASGAPIMTGETIGAPTVAPMGGAVGGGLSTPGPMRD